MAVFQFECCKHIRLIDSGRGKRGCMRRIFSRLHRLARVRMPLPALFDLLPHLQNRGDFYRLSGRFSLLARLAKVRLARRDRYRYSRLALANCVRLIHDMVFQRLGYNGPWHVVRHRLQNRTKISVAPD